MPAALASQAGTALVAAALSEAWESTRNEFAHLLGQGDARKIGSAERRLNQMRDQLARTAGADLEQAKAMLAAQWTARFEDLLEDAPAAAAELQAMLEASRPHNQGIISSDHSLAAGRDVNISSSGGGIAAGVIHGNVAPPNYRPNSDRR